MSLFTPDSPAGRAVRELLHQYKAGLSIPHIRRQAPARGNMSPVTINPGHLADLLGDEAERMGLYLHLIESAGFVGRLDDITVQASTRLLAPAAEIVEQVRAQHGQALAEKFAALASTTGLAERAAIPLPAIEAGRQIGLAPRALDELLYWLAGEERIIYRPFERGFVLRPQPKLWDGSRFDAAAYDAGRIRQEMQTRLAEMRRYAERLGAGDCYRGAALAYFGASRPPTMKSECCNLCDPNMDLPWQDVTPVDFASLEEVMDARYVLLQAVHWNQSLEGQPYRTPYGARSLSYLLTGNRHMLGKPVGPPWAAPGAGLWGNQQDPAKRARRIAQAESSPYFGALEFLPGKDKAVRACLDELVDMGLAGYKSRQFEDGGSYHYPALLPPGEERLRAGMRFD